MGTCLVVLSNAPLVWVERHIDSGVVALFTAMSPLLIAVFNRSRLQSPIGRHRLIGLALGTVGIAILAGTTLSNISHPLPLVVLMLSVASWSFGVTFGRDWPQPRDLIINSGAQMLAGGVLATLVGLLSGELTNFDFAQASTRSLLAWLYLTLFGSMLAYTCYQYLLARVDATKVATSTYVNPVVAIFLGVWLGSEVLDPRVLAAAAFLVPAVVLVVTAPIGSGPGGASAIEEG